MVLADFASVSPPRSSYGLSPATVSALVQAATTAEASTAETALREAARLEATYQDALTAAGLSVAAASMLAPSSYLVAPCTAAKLVGFAEALHNCGDDALHDCGDDALRDCGDDAAVTTTAMFTKLMAAQLVDALRMCAGMMELTSTASTWSDSVALTARGAVALLTPAVA
jgi:hypothetical protein